MCHWPRWSRFESEVVPVLPQHSAVRRSGAQHSVGNCLVANRFVARRFEAQASRTNRFVANCFEIGRSAAQAAQLAVLLVVRPGVVGPLLRQLVPAAGLAAAADALSF